MPRFLPVIASIAMSLLMLGAAATPAFAASGPDYRLSLASAPAVAQNRVAGDVLWRCGPDGCMAASATSRPAIVCARAAKEFGQVTSFAFRGEALDADALAKCNAKAK